MSLWQFECAINGWVAANIPTDDKSLNTEEIEALGDWIDGG